MGQTLPDVQVRNKEKRNGKEHHKKASFFSPSWLLKCFFLFCFRGKTSSFFPMQLFMLFFHLEKVQTNMKGKTLTSSRSQIFFKIAALKNLAILSRKHICWSLFLIKLKTWRPAFLLKKRLQYSCFAVNIEKFFKIRFYLMIKFFGSLRVQNWHFSYLFYHSFFSFMVHRYSVLVFIPKFLVSVTFAWITTSAPALFWLNRYSSEITTELQWRLQVIYCENCEYEFLSIMLCYYFSLEVVLQGVVKNSSTKKQIDAEI